MNITAKTKICMGIGDPISHSLGPKLYNKIYESMGIDDTYVYVACNVKIESIEDFIKGVRAMGIRGVSCTIPHKIMVMQYLDEIDPIAAKIGAVNTIVNDEGKLKGYNTDWLGVVAPLENITSLQGKTVALIGAGGAARAVAFGVTQKGARLTIYNRTLEKAEALAKTFGGKAYPIDELKNIEKADIIFNATAIGMEPKIHETPIPKEYITEKHIVFDVVYTPYETKLLRDAKEKGATIIHGTEMFLHQGIAQFKLYTGYDAPENELREILMKNIGWK
jgi:shikimate dehydrogenase